MKNIREWWNKKELAKVKRDELLYSVGFVYKLPFGLFKHIDTRNVRVSNLNENNQQWKKSQ